MEQEKSSPILSNLQGSSISTTSHQVLNDKHLNIEKDVFKKEFNHQGKRHETLGNSQFSSLDNDKIPETNTNTEIYFSKENIKNNARISSKYIDSEKNDEKDEDEELQGGIHLFKRYNLNAEMLNTRSVGICVTIFLISPFIWLIMY